MNYELSFAGVPFCSDIASPEVSTTSQAGLDAGIERRLTKYQPKPDIISELNRVLPPQYLSEFSPPPSYPGRNLSSLAKLPTPTGPDNQLRIGDWYYPTGASRWGAFRGVASTSQKEAMLRAVGGGRGLFTMTAVPNEGVLSNYQLRTFMYMLPPRPLQDLGGEYDGLYLVTLVDERYYFQGSPVSLHVDSSTTWTTLLNDVSTALGIALTLPDIDSVYGKPELDSQLWTNFENAAFLLDTICANIGSVVVRNLGGSYSIYNYLQSQSLVSTNRNIATTSRIGGGNLYASGQYPRIGTLQDPRNPIVPAVVNVTFPKYVVGDDPVPHFLDPRNQNQRRSCWYEQSYGDVYNVTVPITSGGPLVSGLVGQNTQTLRCTAKALISGEADTTPVNASGLTSLAMRLAGDRYNAQAASALDEVYPGTFAWTPEGIHDIVWTYSERSRLASTRVLRPEWTAWVNDLQHAGPPLSGYTSTPRGVGGPAVAQTWQDSISGWMSTPQTTLAASLSETGMAATLTSVSVLPTNNRWKGQVGSEIILFEGTNSSTVVDIVLRGIDGTVAVAHSPGEVVRQVVPDNTYGVNLVSFGKGMFCYPKEVTSGGITGVEIPSPIQTVLVQEKVSQGVYNGLRQVYAYTDGGFISDHSIIIIERNAEDLEEDKKYAGQFLGYAGRRPVYAANASPITSGGSSGNPLLTVQLDDGTSTVSGVGLLQLHTPTWLIDSPSSGTAREKLNWFDSTPTPIAAVGNPGVSEQPSRGDHTHAIASGAINSGNFSVVNWTVNFYDIINFFEEVNFNKIVVFASGQTFGSGGANLYMPNWGQQYLSGDFNVMSGGLGWQDTGLGVTIASAGVYVLSCDVAGFIQTNVGPVNIITVKLYNSTSSGDVPNSIRECIHTYMSGSWQDAASINTIYNISGNGIDVKLYAKLTYTAPPAAAKLLGNSGGPTILNYHQLLKGGLLSG